MKMFHHGCRGPVATLVGVHGLSTTQPRWSKNVPCIHPYTSNSTLVGQYRRRILCYAAPPSPAEYVEHCNAEYAVPQLIEFGFLSDSPSSNGGNSSSNDSVHLPVVRLRHPQGSCVTVCLHGATVTSWKRPDGTEMLSLDGSNRYDGDMAISGGITVAWPQLGSGPLPSANGVLQHVHWSVAETSYYDSDGDPCPSVTLYADHDDVSQSPMTEEFSHPFQAVLSISLGLDEKDEAKRHTAAQTKLDALREMREAEEEAEAAKKKTKKKKADGSSSGSSDEDADEEDVYECGPTFVVTYELSIMNTSENDELKFTSGAMARFATEPLEECVETIKVSGLVGKYVLDYSKDPMMPALDIENDHFIKIDPSRKNTMNRLYVDCPKDGEVLFCPGTQHHMDVRNQTGFSDILLSHTPGANAMSITAARKARPVRLKPQEVWKGEVKFKAFDRYWDISPFEMEQDPEGLPVPPKSEAFPPRQAGDDA